jgi:hypothetical protein
MAKKLNKDTAEINSVDADLTGVLEDVTGVKKTPGVVLHNAPKKLKKAIERIMELEMRLSDLHRACEIAVVCKDFSLMESFLAPSEAALANKIVEEHTQSGPMKITIVTDKKEETV